MLYLELFSKGCTVFSYCECIHLSLFFYYFFPPCRSLSPSLPPLPPSLTPSLPPSLTPSLPPFLPHSLSHSLPPSLPPSLPASLPPRIRRSLNERAGGGYKLSVNDFVVKAAALAMSDVPEVNSSWMETFIRQSVHINQVEKYLVCIGGRPYRGNHTQRNFVASTKVTGTIS